MTIQRTLKSRFCAVACAVTAAMATAVLAPLVPSTAHAATAVAQTVPAGFVKSQLASGLHDPVVLAFAPNGDIYLGQQGGTILIYRNGAVLPTPLGTLNVYNQGETGLLGLALDPNYATNGYLYASYSLTVTNNGVSKPFTQLSRFTVANGAINLASEKVFLRGNQVQNQHHAGNDLKVGPDGKLWWSVGDNVPSIKNAQTLTNIYGKILRFNLDGTVPSDNPFGNVSRAVPYIYAYGLRNPFRFTFLPDGRAMTSDTGSSYWEELDTIQPGANYGWPFYEGQCFGCGYVDPAYAYGHLPTDGAISAIAAYSGTGFGQRYAHTVFIGDYNRADIEAITFDPTYSTEVSQVPFDTAAGTIADLVQGPDGNLYYVSIFEGTFTEISANGPMVPAASASGSPSAGLAPLTVQFSSAGSADPNSLPLTYSWDFGDGSALSTEADPTHTYTSNGTYTATLTVSNGGQSASATAKVVVGAMPPTASISAPATYSGGDTLSFNGTATDPQDGTLPASAYTWQVDYISHGVVQPFYNSEVAQPFYGPTTGSTSGSVALPDTYSSDLGSLYRITLTVVDSAGATTTVSRDVKPTLTSWSVSANVAGAGYFLDGALQTGPVTWQDRVGTRHVLTGIPSQSINGVRYRFRGWSDGSALTDTFIARAGSGSLTAIYDPVGGALPAPWQSVDIGAPLMAGMADYEPTTATYYLDGSGSDEYTTKDQLHYVFQNLAADGSIVARIRYQTAVDPWAKAGLEIRQAASVGSSYVDALVTADQSPNLPNVNGLGCTTDGCLAPLPPVQPTVGYGVRMQAWQPSGESTATAVNLPGYQSPNKWLKLQRVGSTITTYESVDGTTWTKIGTSKVLISGPAVIGLWVTSHDVGQVSSVAFDNVKLTGQLS